MLPATWGYRFCNTFMRDSRTQMGSRKGDIVLTVVVKVDRGGEVKEKTTTQSQTAQLRATPLELRLSSTRPNNNETDSEQYLPWSFLSLATTATAALHWLRYREVPGSRGVTVESSAASCTGSRCRKVNHALPWQRHGVKMTRWERERDVVRRFRSRASVVRR